MQHLDSLEEIQQSHDFEAGGLSFVTWCQAPDCPDW